MSIRIREWELPLLSLAYEARQAVTSPPRVEVEDRNVLERAYDYCESITAINSRSFSMASRFLPLVKRRSVRALYAFCRSTDDIVDRAPGGEGGADAVQAALASWRARSLTPTADATDPIVLAWTDARSRFGIPQRYAEQLIHGVAQDITCRRYETFSDLTTYCYEVAATVGLMSMHIIGYSDAEAIRYALKLGVAMQLTNILRDVGEDWRAGRLYLPQEDLRRFDLDECDVDAGIVDERWRKFMQFQIERNRQIYEEACPGIALLHADGRFAITAAAHLYRAILEDIEAHDYDVFSRRAHVSRWGKLKRLPAIWWRSKTVRPLSA
jgi:phytoene synthase